LKSLNKLDELQAYRFRETLLFELKQDLDALYRQDIAESQMRVEKAQRFQQFKQAYGVFKQESWMGKGYMDRWFDKPLNNARINLSRAGQPIS